MNGTYTATSGGFRNLVEWIGGDTFNTRITVTEAFSSVHVEIRR